LISSDFVCNFGKNVLLALHCGVARPVCGLQHLLENRGSSICDVAVEGSAQNQSADHGFAKTPEISREQRKSQRYWKVFWNAVFERETKAKSRLKLRV
jgi:hypothetical protein